MGYSMRTQSYRYTLWVPFGKETVRPNWTLATEFVQEELYDHFREMPSDFTRKELVNLAGNELYVSVKEGLRERLMTFIKEELIFLGPVFKMKPLLGYWRNGTVLEEATYGKSSRLKLGSRERKNKRLQRKRLHRSSGAQDGI